MTILGGSFLIVYIDWKLFQFMYTIFQQNHFTVSSIHPFIPLFSYYAVKMISGGDDRNFLFSFIK